MLPLPSDPAFPAALKARREARGLSRSALARAANIHVVMPRRYEDADCADFTHPRHDTWVALNQALGYDAPASDMPDATAVREEEVATYRVASSVQPLTIAQAKAGLALAFGVDPSKIDITIRG